MPSASQCSIDVDAIRLDIQIIDGLMKENRIVFEFHDLLPLDSDAKFCHLLGNLVHLIFAVSVGIFPTFSTRSSTPTRTTSLSRLACSLKVEGIRTRPCLSISSWAAPAKKNLAKVLASFLVRGISRNFSSLIFHSSSV